MKWTQEQLSEISLLQEKHNLTRKSAVQRLRRSLKKAAPVKATNTAPKSGKPESKTWAQANGARAAKLYRAGKSVPAIAEAFGDRTRQNRVRGALVALGLYEIKTRKTAKKSPRK